jgi:hypothetical protein
VKLARQVSPPPARSLLLFLQSEYLGRRTAPRPWRRLSPALALELAKMSRQASRPRA